MTTKNLWAAVPEEGCAALYTISLAGDVQCFLVDEADVLALRGRVWRARKQQQGKGYAREGHIACTGQPGQPSYQELHRAVAGALPGEGWSFKNGNAQDCRRANLERRGGVPPEKLPNKPAQEATANALLQRLKGRLL